MFPSEYVNYLLTRHRMSKQKSDHKMVNFRNLYVFRQQFVQHQESRDTAHFSVDLILLFAVSHRAYIESCTRNSAQDVV